jgi:hypothetical protein
MDNQLTVSIGRLKPIIREASIDYNEPVLGLAAPGIGKSEVGLQAAGEWAKDTKRGLWIMGESPSEREGKVGFWETIWSQHTPEDIKFPALKNGEFVPQYSTELPLEGNEARFPAEGLWVHDEITKVEPYLGKALMQLILERRLGTRRVLPGWRMVAFGNRVKDRSYAQVLAPPLANRFIIVNVEPNLDDWVGWALQNEVHPLGIAFLRFRPALLHKFDHKLYAGGEMAFPSPRQWTRAFRFIGMKDGDTRVALLAGCVGSAAALEFEGFARVWENLPSFSDICKTGGKGQKVPKDQATLLAVVTGLVTKTTEENAGNVFDYIKRLPGEYQMLYSKDLIRKDPLYAVHEAYNDWCGTAGANLQ